jgi:putative DNA primase/helicase
MTAAEPDLDQAWRFLELLDPDDEQFCFQTFDDSPAKRRELAKVTHGALDAEAHRLAKWQECGAGVYVTINRTDGTGRKAGNITKIRATFADLDGSPIEPVCQCPLDPHIIVESSPGKYHAY